MNSSYTLHQLFEAEVKKNPDKNALLFNKHALTYDQLNQRANQIAHYLRQEGIKPDMPVVVCIERSFEFFIAVLGILKAGGAYIPLDNTHPEERLLFIANESHAAMVITTAQFQGHFKRYTGKVLLVNDPVLAKQAKQNPEPTATPANLAYVIYTSGSTGTPKGVLIEHKGVVNYTYWFAKECIKNAEERIDCSSNTAFDFALTLTIVPLILGLCVVICEDTIKKDPRRYIEHLEHNAVSLIKITPSYFKVLFYELQNKKKSLPRLKKIMLAGENLSTLDCVNWLKLYPEHTLYNEYGPTETSVAVTLFVLDKHNVQQLNSETVPIGYLIPNSSAYILNERLEPVPTGELGELYLGGLCLARGYLNNETLTQHYFIANTIEKSGKLYKTGDLCRQMDTGEFECMGRIDHQLKIRGFRVELEEIEQCLSKHPAIKTAVVIASDKYVKEKRLIAYYLLHEAGITINEKELRTYLARFLPDYMIPVLFVKLEHLPLNANQKLDRTALPVPQGSNSVNYQAPKKPLEKKLAALWFDELGIDWIGINDNFFELGGHSLSAARVISKINQHFKKEISLQSFYQAPTIAQLVPVIKNAKKLKNTRIKVADLRKQNGLPLSDFQLMLWLADAFEPKAKTLNIFTRKRIQGRLDINNLNKAFAALLHKHKILSYRIPKFRPNHYLQKHQGLKIAEHNLALLSDAESELVLEDSYQQLKNYHPWPKNKPQIITRLFYLKNGLTELQISMPHLIADDLCPAILLDDLSHFYDKPRSRRTKEKNVYQEYVAQEQNYFKNHLQEDIAFWDDYLQNTHLITLPKQYIVADMEQRGLPYSTYAQLSDDLIEHFKNYCAQHQISILDGLCAALMLALQHCIGKSELAQGPICINRVKSTRDNEDYDNSLGCFLRLEPIKLSLTEEASLDHLAQKIHEEVMHTAPFQKCSNLVKLASIGTFRQPQSKLKHYSLKLGVWLYTTLTGLKINRDILNMTSRLNSDKGSHFLINMNVQSNFITPIDKYQKEEIFGLKVQPVEDKPGDLLNINNLLDVCFMRMNNNLPYLVLSANLQPKLREQLCAQMIKVMQMS